MGCGASGSDEGSADHSDFRASYDAIRPGPPMNDAQFAEIVTLATDSCKDDKNTFLLTYSMLVDGGGPSAEGFRLSVREFCPDRLNELP